jgi:hypothetical protein
MRHRNRCPLSTPLGYRGAIFLGVVVVMNSSSGNFTDCRSEQPLPADGATICLNATGSTDPGDNVAQFCTFVRLLGGTGVHGSNRQHVTWRLCNFVDHHGNGMVYQRLGTVVVENCILLNCTNDS